MFGFGFPELFIIVIILGVIFGIRLIVRTVNAQSRGTKTCPFCAERIQAAAIICRFCNRDVSPHPS